jgi:hypothetical protein
LKIISSFFFIGPLLLVLEFCSLGTLESNLRESNKRKEMFKKKNGINLANEIAKGMEHLSDARVKNYIFYQIFSKSKYEIYTNLCFSLW